MLDPLTSLGLAANILQLTSYVHSLIKTGKELARDGSTKENVRLYAISKDTKEICDLLWKQKAAAQQLYQRDLDAWIAAQRRQFENDKQGCETVDSHDLHGGPNGTTLAQLQEQTREQRRDGQVAKQFDETQLDYSRGPQPPKELPGMTALVGQVESAADELIRLLEDLMIQPSACKRKRDAIVPTLRTAMHASKLQKLHKQLINTYQPLTLHLTAIQNQNASDILQRLKYYTPGSQERRGQLLTDVENAKSDIIDSCCGGDREVDRTEIESIVARALDLARTVDLGQRILPVLLYDEIYMREDSVPNAHATTFEWIYTNSTLGFEDWATSPCGELYWITGKPGSGKSTLMKFIIHEPRTRLLVEQWSGQKPVHFVSHYFWTAGSPMQKTQAGLLRALLFQIFSQCPELMSRLLPRRLWNKDALRQVPWTMAELSETLSNLAGLEELDDCFCLFIDGLDEYQGDHDALISLLDSVAKSPHVKLCVSSRPWNVFSRAYRRRRHLAVEQLTTGDIRRYINDTLHANRLFCSFERSDSTGAVLLMDEVTNKAQGVFLWVYLVGRSLVRGLANNDTLEILLERLREMPDSLDGFFRRMFDRIESVYKRQAARILLAAYHADYALPLSTPDFIAQETTLPDYAIVLPVQPTAAGETTSEQIRRTKTTLDARCADLLEASIHGISCLHRTVKDFLGQKDVFACIQTQADSGCGDGEFNVGICLARLALAALKTCQAPSLEQQLSRILRCEPLIGNLGVEDDNDHRRTFLGLLQDFDDNGQRILDMFLNCQPQDSNMEHSPMRFDDKQYALGFCAFQLRPHLGRLRGTYEGAWSAALERQPTPNEDDDFITLFCSETGSRREHPHDLVT